MTTPGGDDNTPRPADLGWWCISGQTLLAMLRRAAAGEHPDLIYAEEYANSQHDEPQSTP